MPLIESNQKPATDVPETLFSIFKKVARGGVWLLAIRILIRIFSFIKVIILAVVLSPKDFGLFGIVLLTLALLETISKTGFNQALIQKKQNVESFLDTAWTVKVVRGIALFLILFFSSPLIAQFFVSPDAEPLLKVMAITILIGGFKNPGVILFQKELDFKKNFFYELPSVLTDIVVSLILVFLLRNVWALVFGALASGTIKLLTSFLIHPHRPCLEFDKTKLKKLFGFGKWITGSQMLFLILTRGDEFIIGKMLNTVSLGFYQMSQRLSVIPVSELNYGITSLIFPAYATIQGNSSLLKRAFLSTLVMVAFISVPLIFSIIIFIPDFIDIVIGKKWEPIIPIVRILALCGWFRALSAVWGSLYLSQGMPRNYFMRHLLRAVITYAPIIFMIKSYGMSGVAIAILAGILSAFLYDMHYTATQKALNITCKEIGKILLWHLVCGISAATATVLLKMHFSPDHYLVVALMIFFLAVYLLSVYVLDKLFHFSLIKDIKQILRLFSNTPKKKL